MSGLATSTIKFFRGEGTGTIEPERGLKIGLLTLGLFHLVYFSVAKYNETAGITGIINANGDPVGGDFINLWSVAKLILSDRIADIYRVDHFMAYQNSVTDGADIDLRL